MRKVDVSDRDYWQHKFWVSQGKVFSILADIENARAEARKCKDALEVVKSLKPFPAEAQSCPKCGRTIHNNTLRGQDCLYLPTYLLWFCDCGYTVNTKTKDAE